ncbi:MAG TPA: glycoside hydrolase domain-containing protein [Polyangiaceae bacterium]|nr:glycoside hydrolase domain-containing protein [Polyangiaceae bacterium]
MASRNERRGCARGLVIGCVVAAAWALACTPDRRRESEATPATSAEAPVLAVDPNAPHAEPIGAAGYWLEDTSRKVQPTTAPPALGGTLVLEGPRDSVQAYQIVLRPEGGGMQNVDVIATDLTTSTGASIPASNVTLFREFFIDFGSVDPHQIMGGVAPAPEQSPTNDARVPDPLIPLVDPYTGNPAGAPFAVDPDTNLPLWVDVQIPADASPGTYTGSIVVTADGQAPMVIPLSLDVWDLTLPDSRSVTTYFRIDWDSVNSFHAGMNAGDPDADPRTRVLVHRYEEMAHSHRVDPLQIWVPSPNGCSAPTDWTAFDEAVGPYLDGSHWNDGVPSTYFGGGIPIGNEDPPCSSEQYTELARDWASHLTEKGWLTRTWDFATDEPPSSLYPTIARQSGWAQAGDPDWKPQIIDTTMPRTSSAPLLNGALGVYVLCLKCFGNWDILDDPNDPGAHVYGRPEWPLLFSQGIRLWFYESVAQGPPYPGFATNTLDAAEPRILMWGAWYEGATGFLYYSITELAKNDPWGPNITFSKTGDGVLVYPGNHDGTSAPAGSPANLSIDGPVPSLRLKMVRSGLEDWALFDLAARNGLGDVARAAVATAYTQLGGCQYQGCNPPAWYWKTDYGLLSEARRTVAQALMNAGVH